ncbi:hypothetical protein [Dietzia sp. SYD-A1]|uniref:hypothetical protein n=1 Tax=Dietzia sp. SYD-A1 TaxID=2780141 RepID=UPI0018913F1C|nr:hypothetical protein [Dietzia sp. SYD-A1]
MQTLVCTVGTSVIPVVTAIATVEPDSVYLVHSTYTVEAAARIRQYFTEDPAEDTPARHRLDEVTLVEVPDERDVAGIGQAIDALGLPAGWRLDYTGGTKEMVAAAVDRHLAAGGDQRHRTYVNDDTGHLIDGAGQPTPLSSAGMTLESIAGLHGYSLIPADPQRWRQCDKQDCWVEAVGPQHDQLARAQALEDVAAHLLRETLTTLGYHDDADVEILEGVNITQCGGGANLGECDVLARVGHRVLVVECKRQIADLQGFLGWNYYISREVFGSGTHTIYLALHRDAAERVRLEGLRDSVPRAVRSMSKSQIASLNATNQGPGKELDGVRQWVQRPEVKPVPQTPEFEVEASAVVSVDASPLGIYSAICAIGAESVLGLTVRQQTGTAFAEKGRVGEGLRVPEGTTCRAKRAGAWSEEHVFQLLTATRGTTDLLATPGPKAATAGMVRYRMTRHRENPDDGVTCWFTRPGGGLSAPWDDASEKTPSYTREMWSQLLSEVYTISESDDPRRAAVFADVRDRPPLLRNCDERNTWAEQFLTQLTEKDTNRSITVFQLPWKDNGPVRTEIQDGFPDLLLASDVGLVSVYLMPWVWQEEDRSGHLKKPSTLLGRENWNKSARDLFRRSVLRKWSTMNTWMGEAHRPLLLLTTEVPGPTDGASYEQQWEKRLVSFGGLAVGTWSLDGTFGQLGMTDAVDSVMQELAPTTH